MTPCQIIPVIPPYFWQDAHLISCALSFGVGLATGLWLGFKLWRETYLRGLDGRTIRNMRKWRD